MRAKRAVFGGTVNANNGDGREATRAIHLTVSMMLYSVPRVLAPLYLLGFNALTSGPVAYSTERFANNSASDNGCHYVIPVQAKGGKDQIGVVQTTQDIRFVEQKFPGVRCRAISAQFMEDKVVALFELTLQDNQIKVVDERHYKLVPADKLDANAIRNYTD